MPATVTAILATPDVDRLRRFYAGLFGATEATRVPEDGPVFYLGLRLGDSELGLVVNEEVRTGSADDTQQRTVLSIHVDDVDSALDDVAALGGRPLGPPNDMPWGQRVAHIEDPDGNSVNLTQEI